LNKATQARILALREAGAPPEAAGKPPWQQPFNFLLATMNDEAHPITVRIDAAKALMPFTNFRKGMVDTAGRDVPQVVIVRFGDVADELETNDRMAEPKPVTIEHDPSPTPH
jgi:hypothetical protein